MLPFHSFSSSHLNTVLLPVLFCLNFFKSIFVLVGYIHILFAIVSGFVTRITGLFFISFTWPVISSINWNSACSWPCVRVCVWPSFDLTIDWLSIEDIALPFHYSMRTAGSRGQGRWSATCRFLRLTADCQSRPAVRKSDQLLIIVILIIFIL